MTTEGHISGVVGMPDRTLADPVVSLRLIDGAEVHRPLGRLQAGQVIEAGPISWLSTT